MAIHEVRASGLECLALATELLQRARRADAEAGVARCGRRPYGPGSSMELRSHRRSRCLERGLPTAWARAVEASDSLGLGAVEVLARDDDFELLCLLASAGFVAGDDSSGLWFDPVTEVGLVEPTRVEDGYQRRGLARAMLTAGLDRLAKRGAHRLKLGYASDVARGLYVGAGFEVTSTSTSYSWRRSITTD